MYNTPTMSEAHSSPEIYGATKQESVAGGHYRDPDPNVVEWINSKFKDPDDNINATLMKAFEWAGIVKSIKEINGLMKPLEHTGVLPPTTSGDIPPEFPVNDVSQSDFMERREKELLIEFVEGDEVRNGLLNRVKNATARRRFFSEAEEADLILFIRNFRREAPEFTPAFRILRTMLGIMEPDNPKTAFNSKLPTETRSLAPAI